MINSEKLIEAMHAGSLELHCVEVSISQKIDNGLCLNGYGVLRVNKVGTIYLELICKDIVSPPASSFYSTFPDDPFDASQKLYLEAVTLEGDRIYAEEFSITINAFNRAPPFQLHVFFYEIYLRDDDEILNDLKDYLYLEFIERPGLPANKGNSTTDTYGAESNYWNQSDIDLSELKVSIIDKDDRTTVKVIGVFNYDDIYNPLLFYVGLTSGVMPQPYCMIRSTEYGASIHLKSTHKQQRHKKIPGPFPSAVDTGGWPNCHYEILRQMIQVKLGTPLRFDSSYSQWNRVWHAFNSDKNITILTLGVAIEGILNDIFIPALKLLAVDANLEDIKAKLTDKLTKIDAEEDHIESLVKHVERWGNIHAGKALGMLVEKGLVQGEEKKAWGELRHSAAHPTFQENTEARQEKEHMRISRCLTLFYRLVLNVYSYTGPMHEFGKPRQTSFKKREFVKVLN